jgi:TrmH family RNA methyltransferase
MITIRSRDNPRVKRWAKLIADPSFRRTEKKVLIEGPHLVAEALRAGLEPLALMVSEAGLRRDDVLSLIGKREPVVLPDRVFGALVDAEAPAGIAAEIHIVHPNPDSAKPCVFLEGLQDPSNVGAIARTAAAFGVGELVLDRACADPWSPKALRAGQGGHFKLAIRQVAELRPLLEEFAGTLVCTVLREGRDLRTTPLQGRLGWILGAEGKGVSEATARRAALRVTIAMAAGTESINVAAAAAICLYEAFNRQ